MTSSNLVLHLLFLCLFVFSILCTQYSSTYTVNCILLNMENPLFSIKTIETKEKQVVALIFNTCYSKVPLSQHIKGVQLF